MKTRKTRRAGTIAALLTSAALVVSVQAGAHGHDDSRHDDFRHDDFPDSSWSIAVPEININTPAAEGCPIETADGLSLLFASTRAGGVPGGMRATTSGSQTGRA
ncbi:MAG: hypothetical protein WDO68_22000 [Gammaproteobacteria bacterium]